MEKQFRIQRRSGMLIYKNLDDFSYLNSLTLKIKIKLHFFNWISSLIGSGSDVKKRNFILDEHPRPFNPFFILRLNSCFYNML